MSERPRGAGHGEDEAEMPDLTGVEEALGVRELGPVFGGREATPFEQQRQAHRFLTQETRYYILQALLGHPHHLASLDELEYLVSKNRSTVHDHLGHLQDRGIIDKYEIEGNAQNEPDEFWGLTEFGVEMLHEFTMLRYVPVLRVVQDRLYLTEQVRRHQDADRPDLPEEVTAAFEIDDPPAFDPELMPEQQEIIMESTQLFDAPPIELDPDHETEDGTDRPIDELF